MACHSDGILLCHGSPSLFPSLTLLCLSGIQGIYFADCVSKSAGYVYPDQSNGKDNCYGLMMLCEVALGM
jgi:hypothetical protein